MKNALSLALLMSASLTAMDGNQLIPHIDGKAQPLANRPSTAVAISTRAALFEEFEKRSGYNREQELSISPSHYERREALLTRAANPS